MTNDLDNSYYPYSVALEVTLACNMRCLHCGSYADDRNRSNHLSFEEWCRVVDELKILKAKYITLSGGEPFLYPKWRELVDYIKTSDDYTEVMIISNGSKISEDDVKFMKQKGVKNLSISLDGNEKIHDEIRQYPGAFNMVMNLVDRCNKYDLPVSIVTSFNRMNFPIREEVRDLLTNRKIRTWQVQIVNSFGRAGEFKDKMIISKDQYAQLIDDIYEWKKTYKDVLRIMPADSIGYCSAKTDEMLDGAEWAGCNAGLYSLGIEANGNVKGCLSLQDDKFIGGNVRDKSLIEIWKDDDNFAYTRKYDPNKITGNCQNCISKADCLCGCLGMAYSLHNTIYENSYCYKSIRGQ